MGEWGGLRGTTHCQLTPISVAALSLITAQVAVLAQLTWAGHI